MDEVEAVRRSQDTAAVKTVCQKPSEGGDHQAREMRGHSYKPYPGIGVGEIVDQRTTQDNQGPRR